MRSAAARAAVIGWVLIGATAFAQGPAGSAGQKTIPPARPALESIPAPPLEKMEKLVARQMEAMASELKQSASKPGVTDAELAAAYGGLGQLYNAYEVSDAALACYRNANRLAPGDFRWLHLLGYASAQAGDIEKAAAYFRRAAEANPKYPASFVRLGDAYLRLNRMTDARAAWEAALAVNPQDGAAHAGLGDGALAEKKYAEAIPHFEAALKSVPGANRLHYSLAMAYRGAGKVEEARAELAKRGSVGVRPADPLVDGLQELINGERALVLRGRLAYAAGRFGEAAEEFAKAVKADPDSLAARTNLGAALDKAGDEEGAVEQFQAALRIDPEHQTANFNLGSILMRQGHHADAVKYFETVLRKSPTDLEAQKALAESLASSGHPKEALRQFGEALKAHPEDEASLIGTVELLARGGGYKQAIDLLERGYQKFPDRQRTANALARLLAGCPDATLRNGARALSIASRLYQAEPTVAHGETRTMALAQLGRCKEAAEMQRKLVTAADRAGEAAIAKSLGNALERYQAGAPCAPPSQ